MRRSGLDQLVAKGASRSCERLAVLEVRIGWTCMLGVTALGKDDEDDCEDNVIRSLTMFFFPCRVYGDSCTDHTYIFIEEFQ